MHKHDHNFLSKCLPFTGIHGSYISHISLSVTLYIVENIKNISHYCISSFLLFLSISFGCISVYSSKPFTVLLYAMNEWQMHLHFIFRSASFIFVTCIVLVVFSFSTYEWPTKIGQQRSPHHQPSPSRCLPAPTLSSSPPLVILQLQCLYFLKATFLPYERQQHFPELLVALLNISAFGFRSTLFAITV